MKKLLSLLVFVLACGPVEQAPMPPVETWEQFEARSTRWVDGQAVYLVEWDLEVSREALRAHYDAHIAGTRTAEQPLIVHREYGADNIWNATQRRQLTYCVSNDFGSLKERVVNEMWVATAAWEGAADVRFIYDASQDGLCYIDLDNSNTHTNVVFRVVPWNQGGAKAGFPYQQPWLKLQMDYANIDTWQGVTSVAVLTHELGHLLGFRHEHIRPENVPTPSDCGGTESTTWRAVTDYDRASVMHYAWSYCNGVPTTWERTYALTPLDRQGAVSLYGAGTTLAGQNAIDRSEFFVRQVYRDVLGREPDPGALTNGTAWLQGCNGDAACLFSARIGFTRSVFDSQEHRSKHPELNPGSPNYNAAFVTRCYTSFLRRQPDSAGYSQWLNTLNTTGDYGRIIGGFINSTEYRRRFGEQ